MGKLIYSLNVSLDGYVETPDHGLAWATIDGNSRDRPDHARLPHPGLSKPSTTPRDMRSRRRLVARAVGH
jgi:hypothetical protein